MENLDLLSTGQEASLAELRVQLGELLMRERLTQQKDEVDVARRLMLSKLQLLAIEAGESASFHHERRYIQGIKSYVFYLGLQSRTDVSALVTQIESWSAQDLKASPAAGVAQLHRSAAAPAQAKSYATKGAPRYIYFGLGFLIVGAVVLAISEGWPFRDSAQEEVNSESSQVASGASTSRTAPLEVSTTVVTPGVGTSQTGASQPGSQSAPTNATSPQAQIQTQTQSQMSPQSPPATQVQAPKSEPEPEKNASTAKTPPAVAQDGRALMRIDFNAECWVSLQTIEGKKEERIYKQGESLSVPLASVGGLVLGNAPAAKVFLGGKQVDVLTKGLTAGNVTRLDQKSLQLLQKN